MSIQVAIVEDHRDFRETLELVLSLDEGFELGGSFTSVEDLERAVVRGDADPDAWQVVLMDLELPGAHGADGVSYLKASWPHVAVVACTSTDDRDVIAEVIARGADGYLLKSAGLDDLLDRLRKVAAGGSSLSDSVARTVLDLVREQREPAPVSPPEITLVRPGIDPPLVFATHHGEVWLGDRCIARFKRSRLQFQLLLALVRDGGTLSRQQLYEQVWQLRWNPPHTDNALSVAVARLRLAVDADALEIETAHAGGYAAPTPCAVYVYRGTSTVPSAGALPGSGTR